MAAYRQVFMTHVACRLTAKNRDQLRNPTLGNRVSATFTLSTCFHGFEAATGVAGSIPLPPGATTLGKLFARFCPVIRQNNLVPVNGHGRSATPKVTVSSGIAPAARYRLQWSNYARVQAIRSYEMWHSSPFTNIGSFVAVGREIFRSIHCS